MSNQSDTTDRSALRILIIDDDEVFGALCARYLKRATDQNYIPQTVTLASEAIARCLEQPFDCLVVDYRLPDITGTEMLQQLNSELGERMPPAIILTAGSVEEAAVQAIRVRAADFMAKPEITRTSLTRALDNAIVKARLLQSVTEQNKKLVSANDELERRAEEIRQFYQNVSHELKTPLTSIQEFLKLLDEGVCGPVTDEQREVLSYALSGCEQIALHFNDLLDMTRIETGKIQIRPSLNSVAPLVRQCILAFESEAAHRGITIVNKVDPLLPEAWLDPHRYIQIVVNLLSNAVKYAGENGTITISSMCSDSEFSVAVSDTGCGIDQQSIGRIFDRLYQVPLGEEHHASSAGLGLGLAIARDITRMHEGDLTVDSTPGIGSTFTITLPLQSNASFPQIDRECG